MLNEGWRRHQRGTDVVVGLVRDPRPRRAPRRRSATSRSSRAKPIEYRGSDVRGDGRRRDPRPQARRRARRRARAHQRARVSRNEKRWQDVEELLDAGIDVISTLNIQHLESVNDVVERITGVKQQETIPDAIVRQAEQVELVDMTPEALRRRMAHGNIYPAERVDASLANYFRPGNLAALREIALLWVADRVEENLQQYLEDHGIEGSLGDP